MTFNLSPLQPKALLTFQFIFQEELSFSFSRRTKYGGSQVKSRDFLKTAEWTIEMKSKSRVGHFLKLNYFSFSKPLRQKMFCVVEEIQFFIFCPLLYLCGHP